MWGKRESLTANDNDLISVSLKIIRAPSSGRGRRAKRGGVGFPECGSTVSRDQPPPLRGTSFQRKEGEKRGCVYRHRSICGEVGAFSAISATPEPAPTISFPEESGEARGTCGGERESLTAKVQGSRGGFAAIDEEVAAVLAFVISHTTFLAAQDDETGRCPKDG